MTEKQIEEFKVIETLKDAGCSQNMINDFLKQSDNYQSVLLWLDKRRSSILDKVHKYSKELDCLDFLIYKIRKSLNLI